MTPVAPDRSSPVPATSLRPPQQPQAFSARSVRRSFSTTRRALGNPITPSRSSCDKRPRHRLDRQAQIVRDILPAHHQVDHAAAARRAPDFQQERRDLLRRTRPPQQQRMFPRASPCSVIACAKRTTGPAGRPGTPSSPGRAGDRRSPCTRSPPRRHPMIRTGLEAEHVAFAMKRIDLPPPVAQEPAGPHHAAHHLVEAARLVTLGINLVVGRRSGSSTPVSSSSSRSAGAVQGSGA